MDVIVERCAGLDVHRDMNQVWCRSYANVKVHTVIGGAFAHPADDDRAAAVCSLDVGDVPAVTILRAPIRDSPYFKILRMPVDGEAGAR